MNKIFKLLSLSVVISLSACSESASSIKATRNSERVSDIQLAYLTNSDPSNTSPYNGNMSVSAPIPVRLSWSGSGNSFTIKIYKERELNNLVVSYKTSKNYFDFYNDELNTTYYWTVTTASGKSTSSVGEFRYNPTVAQPRNLYIDGVENVRDLGGWGLYKPSNGGYKSYIKQGMIYRSGRFNEDKADPVNITISKNGINELKNHLKIKTEIDLRRSSTNEIGSITSSVLGDDVNYYNLPMYYGGQNILTFTGKASGDTYQYDNPAMIKQFFEILADESNYPVIFHCSIGKDRTGCLAYLVEGLLDFDQELMYRDYMFTNFANAGMCKLRDDILNRYGATIEEYHGDTTQEKVFNYLNEVIGVSTTNLRRVQQIISADIYIDF